MLKFISSNPLQNSWLFALGLAVACGGAQTPPSSEAPPASDGPAPEESSAEASAQDAPAQGAKAFHDMAPGERIDFMKKVITPHMSELFQSANAERYASMNCATCHGAGAKQGHFHMPSPDLPALDPTDGFAAHRSAAPEVTAFMMEKVVPEMARLLGEQPYDPETGRGFGCFACHQQK